MFVRPPVTYPDVGPSRPFDVVAARKRTWQPGVDGFTINLPADGHIPERVGLLGRTVAPPVG